MPESAPRLRKTGRRTRYAKSRNGDITTWIGAKEGDHVTLLPGPVPLNDWNEPDALDGEPRWWLDFISAPLNLVTPLPADAAERKALLRRAMSDIFIQGTDPTDEEYAAFVGDKSPQALTSFAERLFHRAGGHTWAGQLTSGPTKFRVLTADPDAAKKTARRTEAGDGKAKIGRTEAQPVGKLRSADRTRKYELGGNTGGRQILRAEPLNSEASEKPKVNSRRSDTPTYLGAYVSKIALTERLR